MNENLGTIVMVPGKYVPGIFFILLLSLFSNMAKKIEKNRPIQKLDILTVFISRIHFYLLGTSYALVYTA